MKLKMVIGAAMASGLVGIGALVGSVVGAGNVAAQTTPGAGAAPAATATPGTNNPSNQTGPGKGKGFGRHGGFGPGFGGFGFGGPGEKGFGRGGFGLGPGGSGATADNANSVITNVTNVLTTVKSDLAYATGKMDTTDVQRWVTGADSLLNTAKSAVTVTHYNQAIAYANAARELAGVADQQMAAKLGASNLPSYSQRPQRGNRGTPQSVTFTQAQASRVLLSTYNNLLAEGTLIKSASGNTGAATYLTDAQNAYKTAYAAYQAGKYNDAVSSARLADELAGVARAVMQAASIPGDANTPVTVPAPNF